MSTAQFPDVHIEEVHNATLREIFERSEDALDRGAKKVTIYPEPHAFSGDLRRCQLCGRSVDDDIHDVTELVKKIQELSNKIEELEGGTS